jgi:hydrogenase 3 maturation protease
MWQKTLEILLYGERSILFVGIGNVLRSDDGTGVYIVNGLIESVKVLKISAEVSLENYISKINKLSPGILVLVDCVDFGEKPGYTNMLPAGSIFEQAMHSHHITLEKIVDFFHMEVYVLGIQPASLAVGEGLTEAVKSAGDRSIAIINRLIRETENLCIAPYTIPSNHIKIDTYANS